MQTGVVVLALLVLLFGVVSRPVERSVITAPMVFTAAGLLLGASGLGLIEVDLDGEVVSILAEATLGLVLFSDAARINLRRLRADAALPARMLGSLPLVILLGAGAAALLLPDLHLFEAAVLAAVLAPTDAALGQAVVTDERLPTRVRQTLNVESGLNDGIVQRIPFDQMGASVNQRHHPVRISCQESDSMAIIQKLTGQHHGDVAASTNDEKGFDHGF